MKKLAVIIVTLAFLAGCAATSSIKNAFDKNPPTIINQAAGLAGLDAVFIEVNIVSPGDIPGLDKDVITDAVEFVLSEGGVKVAKASRAGNVGLLRHDVYIIPMVLPLETGQAINLILVVVDTSFGAMSLVPNLKEPLYSTSWMISGAAIVGDPRSPVVLEGIISQTLQFINAYREANGGTPIEEKPAKPQSAGSV